MTSIPRSPTARTIEENVLAVDVGGTSIKVARFGAKGIPRGVARTPTPVRDGGEAVVTAISELARRTVDEGTLAATVVLPGVVDVENGVAGFAANLGWRGVRLAERLAADLRVPVFLDRDSHAAGVAEQTRGSAQGIPDCLIVVIGTGISASVVSGGVLVRGARDLAGEFGHICVAPDGELCGCGQRGCVEAYASAAGISNRYATMGGARRSAAEIAGLVHCDSVANKVWDDAVQSLAAALASATMLVDPGLVILAGGLAQAGELLRAPVARALGERLGWRAAPQVHISRLAARAGLVGAAELTWRRLAARP